MLILVSTLMFFAGSASAAPVTFTFESATTFDPGFDTSTVFDPSHPFSGEGDVDEIAGTYDFDLPDFAIEIDVLLDGPDAGVATTDWGQTGDWTPGAGEVPITSSSSTGTVTCTNLGGLGGLVCGSVPATVAPWPPTGASGPTLGAPGSWIDTADGLDYDGTVIVNEAYDANGGQIQSIYRYTFVPEPGTTLMLGTGLAVLFLLGRRD
jgi:hypothetical protein